MSRHMKERVGVSGDMIVTPPREVQQQKIQDREFPFTSRRLLRAEASHYLPEAEAQAVLRRVAAMWNGCANLSTEAIEGDVVNDLISTVQSYLERFEDYEDARDGRERWQSQDLADLNATARAAIAKATGEAR